MGKGKKLTLKQKKFADEYIITGNATEAYKKSYKSVKKDAAARANASKLLTNANVAAYIDERLEEIKSEKVADQQEVMEFLTAIMRGDVREPVPLLSGEGKQKLVNAVPGAQARKSAAELLGKRYAMWTEKQQVEVTPVFVEDVPEDDD